MAHHEFNVKIDLGGLIGELQASVQRVINLVASGLTTKQHITSDLFRLPDTSMGITVHDKLNWDTEMTQKAYSQWLLLNGFRDVIEGMSFFLESAHRVLSFWELFGHQQSKITVTGADWNRIITGGDKKFNKLHFPPKLDHIANEHGIAIDAGLKGQILTINATRNCMVHRNGIVSEADCNVPDGLEIRWTKLVLILMDENGGKEVVPPFKADKGGTIGLRNREERKIFSLGAQIQFTVQEFADICWCLLLFGNSLKDSIQKKGVELGLINLKPPGGQNV